MDYKKLLACAGKNISDSLNQIDLDQLEKFTDALANAKRIFIAGWGRAGNIIRILGMDMSQLGKTVYCVWDNSTPSIQKDDLLVVGSGTGNTKTVIVLAKEAKEDFGATVALISASAPEDSVIGKLADIHLTVPRLSAGTFKKFSVSKDKALGRKLDFGMTPEEREELAYDGVTGIYETMFALNEVLKEIVMVKIGGKKEDILYYHNNLE